MIEEKQALPFTTETGAEQVAVIRHGATGSVLGFTQGTERTSVLTDIPLRLAVLLAAGERAQRPNAEHANTALTNIARGDTSELPAVMEALNWRAVYAAGRKLGFDVSAGNPDRGLRSLVNPLALTAALTRLLRREVCSPMACEAVLARIQVGDHASTFLLRDDSTPGVTVEMGSLVGTRSGTAVYAAFAAEDYADFTPVQAMASNMA